MYIHIHIYIYWNSVGWIYSPIIQHSNTNSVFLSYFILLAVGFGLFHCPGRSCHGRCRGHHSAHPRGCGARLGASRSRAGPALGFGADGADVLLAALCSNDAIDGAFGHGIYGIHGAQKWWEETPGGIATWVAGLMWAFWLKVFVLTWDDDSDDDNLKGWIFVMWFEPIKMWWCMFGSSSWLTQSIGGYLRHQQSQPGWQICEAASKSCKTPTISWRKRIIS